MNTPEQPVPADAPAAIPSAEIARRPGWSWAWLVPIAALIGVGILLYQVQAQRGTIITIRFQNGDGLRPGDPVTYRGVRIGEVQSIALEKGLGSVVVSAELAPDAASIASAGSRFWIVRPEVSLVRVTGLETLLGPRYIAAAPGDGPPAVEFSGLDRAPDEPRPAESAGMSIVVKAPRLGSLGVGSTVAYRGIKVGSVTGYALSADARTVDLTVTIDPGAQHLIRTNSRFWDAGRIGLDWGLLSGVSVKAGSLETLVAGGIAFATPNKPGDAIAAGHAFNLEPKPDDDWLNWSPDLSPTAGSP